MTNPANARPSANGTGRRYTWSFRDPPISLPSVTTIIGALAKPAITNWALKLAAEFAVNERKRIWALAESDPGAAVDLIKRAPWRQRDGRADEGSSVHDFCEKIVLGRAVGTVPAELAGYVKAFRHFLADCQIEPVCAETTVYSPSGGWAGTLDLIAKVPGAGTAVIDYKTSKDIYPEVAYQLTALRWADFIGLPDGTEEPLPPIDRTYALRLGDSRYDLVPVRSDRSMLDAWRALVLTWETRQRGDLLGSTWRPSQSVLS